KRDQPGMGGDRGWAVWGRNRGKKRAGAEKKKTAEEIMADMVVKNSTPYEAYLARIQYRLDKPLPDPKSKGAALDKAAADANAALQLAPNEPAVLLVAADLAMKQAGNLDRAVPEQRNEAPDMVS